MRGQVIARGDRAIWKCTSAFGNVAFTRRGVEQLGSSLGS